MGLFLIRYREGFFGSSFFGSLGVFVGFLFREILGFFFFVELGVAIKGIMMPYEVMPLFLFHCFYCLSFYPLATLSSYHQ